MNSFSVRYHHWNRKLWKRKRKKLAESWDSMEKSKKEEMIGELIIHARDVSDIDGE